MIIHEERMIFLMLGKHDEWNVLRSPFNAQIHKETFINYLEVVILENGVIEYAVPSHQQKVTSIIAKSRNITSQQVADLCPVKYYANYPEWLCNESRCVMVWNDFYIGEPNEDQVKSLIMLMSEGLYKGSGVEWAK